MSQPIVLASILSIDDKEAFMLVETWLLASQGMRPRFVFIYLGLVAEV